MVKKGEGEKKFTCQEKDGIRWGKKGGDSPALRLDIRERTKDDDGCLIGAPPFAWRREQGGEVEPTSTFSGLTVVGTQVEKKPRHRTV